MNVVFLSPAYPPEMIQFTRGLAEVGARVFGVGDGPRDPSLPLADYLSVPRIMDEADVHDRVVAWLGGRRVDRVESNWEPLTILAARLRATLGIPGMSVDAVVGFRDKPVMRERVAKAGLRVPRSVRVRSRQEALEAAAIVGFPMVIKPVAGAGSADTFRVDDAARLDDVLAKMGHHSEASCEEFIDGEELTYETICVEGRPVYESVSYYLPNALVARQNEWISPAIVSVRDLTQDAVLPGIRLGRAVLEALEMGTGFTHMEWFRTPGGEAVFGEIACRSPGANMVDLMNYTSDVDLFREWARAVCHGTVELANDRLYNAAIVFKRAEGQGRISAITGMDAFRRRFGRWIAREELLPVGAPRRDWKQTFLSDGNVVVRHPDAIAARDMALAAIHDIRMYAR